MPYLSCKKIENDVYNFPTWQYCKYKDIFDSRIIINSTAKFYISISYQKDLLSIDTRIFTPSANERIPRRARKSAFLGIVHLHISKSPLNGFANSPLFSTSSVQITFSHFLIHSFAFCISFSSILPNGFTEITSVASAFAAG